MTQQRRIAPLVAAVFVCVAATQTTAAAEPASKAAASPLTYVPSDAVVVLSIRVADYWNQPRFKTEREALRIGAPQAFEGFRSYFGSEPDEVERLTFFSAKDPGLISTYGPVLEPAVVVTTVKPYDRETVLKGGDAARRENQVLG